MIIVIFGIYVLMKYFVNNLLVTCLNLTMNIAGLGLICCKKNGWHGIICIQLLYKLCRSTVLSFLRPVNKSSIEGST